MRGTEAVRVEVSDRLLCRRNTLDGSDLNPSPTEQGLFYTPVIQEDPNRWLYKRQEHDLENGKQERVLIVVTMYNEDKRELWQTLAGLAENIEHMSKLPDEECGFGSGKRGWRDFMVIIVSDGEEKAAEETLEYCAELGIYDQNVKTIAALGMDVHVHMFERTVQMRPYLRVEAARYGPMKVIFAFEFKRN